MASISLGASSAAVGSFVYVAGSGFPGGHTEVVYLNGQFVGVLPTNVNGAFAGNLKVPSVPAGAARPVVAKDNTDITVSATASLTVA